MPYSLTDVLKTHTKTWIRQRMKELDIQKVAFSVDPQYYDDESLYPRVNNSFVWLKDDVGYSDNMGSFVTPKAKKSIYSDNFMKYLENAEGNFPEEYQDLEEPNGDIKAFLWEFLDKYDKLLPQLFTEKDLYVFEVE